MKQKVRLEFRWDQIKTENYVEVNFLMEIGLQEYSSRKLNANIAHTIFIRLMCSYEGCMVSQTPQPPPQTNTHTLTPSQRKLWQEPHIGNPNSRGTQGRKQTNRANHKVSNNKNSFRKYSIWHEISNVLCALYSLAQRLSFSPRSKTHISPL